MSETTVITTPVPDSTVNPLDAKFKELGISDDLAIKIKALGAETVDDLAGLTEADLVGAAGMPALKARRLLTALKPAAPAPDPAVAHASGFGTMSFDGVLPDVPATESWLTALRTGGVLKVDQSTVIGAVRAALAHRCGLFDVLERLVKAMERFTDETEEQADPEFFRLRKLMTRRSYAEIFEAIDGLDGSFVTEARKQQLFARINESLWPSIVEFYNQLKAWQEAWLQGAANPMLMMGAFMAASGSGSPMPAGIMQPPDTGVLRDHADAVADAVNKVFRGTGVQIASALAYDANRIVETLQNSRLPSMIGAANRDQMLRQLDVAVPATYPRLELNLTKFVLAILQAREQPAGNDELRFFSALFMLGSQIPWDTLGNAGGTKLTGVGGRRPHGDL